VNFDSFNSIRNDRVQGVFYDEHPIIWYHLKDVIERKMRTIKGDIDFLDVGCGSGFWAIIVKKKIGGRVLAIDKLGRAVKFSKKNANINGVNIEIRKELYSVKTAPPKKVKVICLNPPYHIYSPEIEDKIPVFARGGSYGQNEFKNQLEIAGFHVAPDGIITFNMECLGMHGKPQYIDYYKNLVGSNPSICFTNIIEPASSEYYLRGIYKNRFTDFIDELSNEYPEVFYTVGYITNDRKGKVEEVPLKKRYGSFNWEDRIEAHRKTWQNASEELK